MNTIILGAGITGLAAGFKTGATIYEKTGNPGGICQTYHKDGYTFENGGGHWMFGSGKAIDFTKTYTTMDEYERKAGIYYNTIMDYPIQTFANKEPDANQGTMKEWLLNKFGKEMCNMFFFPFNNRYTAGRYNYVIQDDEYKSPSPGGLGFVPSFHYPRNGWTESFIKPLASQCKIEYKKTASSIDTDKKEVAFSDGDVVGYDRLISTIPLDDLLMMAGRTPLLLPYTSVLVLNIGAEKGVNFPDKHWLYVPFNKTGFFRIGFYSNVVYDKAPQGKCALCVEMAFGNVEAEFLDLDVIQFEVMRELQGLGIIGKVDVYDPKWIEHAYTWLYPSSKREEYIKWLNDRDIISIGRYGKWKFQGMAASIEDGLSVYQ